MGNLLGSPVTEKETHTGETAEGLQYGVSSMQGWRVHMEDAHICEPNVYALDAAESSSNTKIPLPGHSLFAVFDGHGGTFAAEYAGANLCRVLSAQPKFVQYAKFVQDRPVKEASLTDEGERVQYVRSGLDLLEGALRDAFVDIDCEILMMTRGDPVPDANVPYHAEEKKESGAGDDDDAMKDGDDATTPAAAAAPTKKLPVPNLDEDAGTTAVVVVVTPHWIVCANAGDSRAVMAKHGHKVVPLSYDHKPDDEEEERRIRAGGGYVAGGRVEGDLAVSRGYGDYRFKLPSTVLMGTKNDDGNDDDDDNGKARSTSVRPDDQKVSPIPDIIVQNRSAAQDEFMIVACDGIWDVQTNYECVKAVADLFEEGESNMGLAAEEMLDLCLSMGSKDNMTTLLVKFPAQKSGDGGGVTARRQKRDAVQQAATTAPRANEDDT